MGAPSGATMGAAATAAWSGLCSAAAVSALRSMRPESSVTEAVGADGRLGLLPDAAEVSAESEKSTDDSLRAPVPAPPPPPNGLEPDEPDEALVAISEPAFSMPPNRSGPARRTGLCATGIAGLAAASPHGLEGSADWLAADVSSTAVAPDAARCSAFTISST